MTNEDRPAEPGTDLPTPDPAATAPAETPAETPAGDPSLAALVGDGAASEAPVEAVSPGVEAPAAAASTAEPVAPAPPPPVAPPVAPPAAAVPAPAPAAMPAPVVTTATPAKRVRRWPRTLRSVLAFLFGILQALLILRILLLFLNANPDDQIVAWILNVTEPFVEPFRGMFSLDEIEGANGSVVDVAAIVALVAWTLIETLVLSLLRLFDRRR